MKSELNSKSAVLNAILSKLYNSWCILSHKMAEGWSTGSPQQNLLCRYYLNGCCRDGSNCHFSHDRTHSQPSNVCRFYVKGVCTYGERCRYDHVKPVPVVSNESASSPTAPSTSNNNRTRMTTVGRPTAPLASMSSDGFSKMTVLKRQQVKSLDSGIGEELTVSPPLQSKLSQWVEAPEFVPIGIPKQSNNKSYAQAVDADVSKPGPAKETEKQEDILCPYAIMGECRFGDQCVYLHGDICELCSQAMLHPTDDKQRRLHREECIQAHERDMELSFAFAQSKDKVCSICMDVIMEKWPVAERRFGILPNCTHVFCLTCIRTWRNTKQLENKTIRSCPQCRTPSDYVTPSKFWVETKEEKEKLIVDYKKALSMKPCKYFKQGNGECPFAGNCFYLHAYPDGQKANLPPPRPRRRRNGNGDLELMQQFILWDYLEGRESQWLFRLDFEEMLDLFTDSDDSSDWSDFDT